MDICARCPFLGIKISYLCFACVTAYVQLFDDYPAARITRLEKSMWREDAESTAGRSPDLKKYINVWAWRFPMDGLLLLFIVRYTGFLCSPVVMVLSHSCTEVPFR